MKALAVSATEFKAKCLMLLDEVQRTGQELVISKRGKPVARVIAEHPRQPWIALRGTGKFTGNPFDSVAEESEIEALKRP
jgi:prevent-host-death family protein